MNERIRELAGKAGAKWHTDPNFTEKFAELIVKECVRGINRDGWYWNSNSVEELCEKMEKHFGIE